MIHDRVEDVDTMIGGRERGIYAVQKIGGMDSVGVKVRLTERFHLSKAELNRWRWIEVCARHKGLLRPPTMEEARGPPEE